MKISPSDKKGSALLLTLLVVSLLMVLVLSFVVFVRLQLRETLNEQNLRIARQNARLGMELAVSQLQKYAGADQRVTAPATAVYPWKDFDELYDADEDEGSSEMFSLYRDNANTSTSRSFLNQVATYTTPAERRAWDAELADWWNGPGRNPHWIGVFNSARRMDRATNPTTPTELTPQYYEINPDTLHGEPQRNQLPVWLISGNERLNFNPLTDASYPADYLTPDRVLPDPDATDSETVWLVGEGSATRKDDSVDGLDGRVKAPKQDAGTGTYAYWVGDESLKANFAVREPEAYASSSPGTVEYRNRLQVPQRIGWERMEGFADVFDANPRMEVNAENFAKVVSQAQIGLVNPGFIEPVRKNFHHVTSTSQSLLTDTALGGLKKDLTRYLEDGEGPDDDDPIPDPARYDLNDSRFATWGTDPRLPDRGDRNTGFPNDSDAALDGIPTFGQLRSWYLNDAEGAGPGTIDPDPPSGAVPVLSYMHLQNGMSYDGGSKMMRMHWSPIIALWNPMDVGLNEATYEMDAGIVLHLTQFLLANEGMKARSRLSERAALDPEAGWREVTLQGPDFLDRMTGKKILKAESMSNDPDSDDYRKIVVSNVDQPGTYEVFKVVFTRPDSRDGIHHPPPDGDMNNRYMAKMTGNPESYNMADGPFVYDNQSLNAKSDAFGRIYYATKPGQSSGMFHARSWAGTGYHNSHGALANGKAAFVKVGFHYSRNEMKYQATPVDRPFRFRFTTSFEPGEVKVFTLGDAEEWTLTNRLTLVNDYDPDFPEFFWTDVMEVVDGPASSESETLRWHGTKSLSSPGYNKLSPSVKLSVDGDLFFETLSFGGGGGWEMAEGNDYNNRSGPNNSQPNQVHNWRPLYDFENFEDNLQTQTGSLTDRSNWAFGDYFLAPFGMREHLGKGEEASLHTNHAVLSRYNMGSSRGFESHPLTELPRSVWGVNNRHPVTAPERYEGLTTYRFQRGSGNGLESTRWDNNQVDQSTSTSRGFALSSVSDDGSDIVEGLTQVAIRNAKRADSEILSLGQLQQVNLSPYFWQPSFPIGNSDATAYTDREAIAGIHSRMLGAEFGSARFMAPWFRPNHARSTPGRLPFPDEMVAEPSRSDRRIAANPKDGLVEFWGGFAMGVMIREIELGGNTMLDLSYLLNENIWDRFFLSTLTTPPASLEDPLPNARLRFNDKAVSAPDLLDYDLTSAYLTAVGSLNVNSTSVEAWKALLTSFRGLELGGSGEQNPEHTVPVTRTLTPIEGAVTFEFDNIDDDEIGAVPDRKDFRKVFSGFRYLTDDMIQALAERIVDEVRLRGPFYSLGDFINRRLAPPSGSGQIGSDWYQARTKGTNRNLDYLNTTYDPFPGLHGLNGTLQRAINLSGINGGVNHPDLGDDGDLEGNRFDMVYSLRIRNQSSYNNHTAYTNTGIGGAANAYRGAEGSGAGYKYSNDPSRKSHLDSENVAAAPAGEAGQLMQGAPGFVTQGDLLAMIGPALTARGDTFLIRSYGDAAGAGDPNARAWLEAVVQRVQEPLRAAGDSGEDAWRPVDSFGRRFKVVSVRWLVPEEI